MLTESGAGDVGIRRISTDRLIGISVFVVNLVLRTSTAGKTSLSLDEAASVWHCGQPWPAFVEFLQRDATPPLFSLILRAWTSVFGIAEVAVRFPSLMATSATAAVVFHFGNRWMGRRAGLLAAVLFSLSPLQMLVSQTARVYAIVGLSCALSTSFFVGFLLGGGRKAGTGLVFSDLAVVYSHYAAGLLLVARCAAIPMFSRNGWRRLLAFAGLQALVLVAFLPGLFRIDADQVSEPGRWFDSPGIGSLRGMWTSICGGGVLAVLFAVILLAGSVVILARYRRAKFDGAAAYAAWLSWGVGSIGVGWIVSQWVPLFMPRYLAFAGGGVALAVAGALVQLMKFRGFRSLGWAATAAVVAFSVAGYTPAAPVVEDWRGAAIWLRSHRQPETKLVVSAGYQCRTLVYALNRELFREYRSPHRIWFEYEKLMCVDILDQETLDRLDADHILLIQSHSRDVDPENETGKTLENGYRQLEMQELAGITLGSYGRNAVARP